MRVRSLVVTALLALCGTVRAQSNEELKATLDQALKTIQDLQARVKALEAQRVPTPASPAWAPVASEWGAAVVAPGSRADEGAKDAGQARVEVYGQVMLDAVADTGRMNPAWAATLRPSQIPVACPGSPGCGQEGSTVFSVRQSSLGLRAFIPSALGPLRTDLSFDLFGTDGSTSVHWLRAWAEIGHFGVGQTESNFMDLDVFPNVVDYWGPSGLVFMRNPQLRYSLPGSDGLAWAFSLEAPNSVLDTGKLTAVDPSLGAGITGWTRLPDAVASLTLTREGGHLRAAAILRQVGFQNSASPDGQPSGQRTGYGLNLSGAHAVLGKDRVSWQLVAGQAIASYMNDGGVDLAPGARLRAQTVPSLGWMVYYGHAWADQWTSSIGLSQHQQDNTTGQLGSAFRRGSYGSLNLLHTPARNITAGAEWLWGRLETRDGSSATDVRLQFSTKLTF